MVLFGSVNHWIFVLAIILIVVGLAYYLWQGSGLYAWGIIGFGIALIFLAVFIMFIERSAKGDSDPNVTYITQKPQ